MKKSRLLLVLPMMATMSLAVGCSDGDAPSTETSSVVSEAPASSSEAPVSSEVAQDGPFITEPTTIEFRSTIGTNNQPMIERYIEAFKEIEPNVTVTNVKYEGNYNALKENVVTGFSGNNYPDIVQCYPDHVAEYIDYGKAVNLDSYIENPNYGFTEEDWDDYIPAYLEEGSDYAISGTYSMPFSKSTEAMFYNPAILNITIPGVNNGQPITEDYINNLTWDELFNVFCPAFMTYNASLENPILDTSISGASVVGYDSDDNFFITLAQQYGYGYTSINPTTGVGQVDFVNDGMKGLMKQLNDWSNKGYLTTKGKNNGDYVNTLFVDNGCIFSIGSTGGISYQLPSDERFVPKMARLPQAGGDHELAMMNQGPSLAVLDHGDENRKLASWLFYKFITNEENSLVWALNSGYSAIRYSSIESQAYGEATDETGKDGIELLTARNMYYTGEYGDILFVSPAFIGSSECRTQAGSIVTQVVSATSLDDATLDSIFNTARDQALLQIK